MRSRITKGLLDKPYLVWSLLFIVAPLVMVLYFAFTDRSGAFSLDNIMSISDYFSTILLSVIYGLIATIICLILGYPFAYFLSKHTEHTQRTMVLLVMLPMWMNFLIRTYSLMTILGESGVINTFLDAIGLRSVHLINTPGAVILGMVYNFLPYMILPIYSVLSKMDNSLIEAAWDLGSNRITTFRRVVLPMSVPGLLSGITMVFVPCVSTFYITQKLGGGQIVLIGDIIESQFQSANNYNLGASLSFVLMILIFICLGVMNHYDTGNDDGGVVI
ncbi:MAG: ABC transporter permease [Eubacterium sp.]